MTVLVPVLVGLYLLGAVGLYKLSVNARDAADKETIEVFTDHPKLTTALLVAFSALWPVVIVLALVLAAGRKVL